MKAVSMNADEKALLCKVKDACKEYVDGIVRRWNDYRKSIEDSHDASGLVRYDDFDFSSIAMRKNGSSMMSRNEYAFVCLKRNVKDDFSWFFSEVIESEWIQRQHKKFTRLWMRTRESCSHAVYANYEYEMMAMILLILTRLESKKTLNVEENK